MNKRFVSLICFLLLAFLINCGGGGGGDSASNQTDNTSTPQNDYQETIIQEGNYGTGGRYSVEYFENAAPAQKQLVDNDIPMVVSQTDEIYLLDIQSWPSDWALGSIIVIQMKGGEVVYKRLIMKFAFSGGRLAIGAIDASVLEAVDNMDLNTNGIVNAASLRKVNRGADKHSSVVDYDFSASAEIDIFRKEDLELFKLHEEHVDVDIRFPDISLTIKPKIDVSIQIDKPVGLSNIMGEAINLGARISRAAAEITVDIGDITFNGTDVISVAAESIDDANFVLDQILVAQEIVEIRESIRAVLRDKRRLRYGYASLSGDIVGNIDFLATVTAAYSDDTEKSLGPALMVPISGPVPLYLEFGLSWVAEYNLDAKASVSSGAEVVVPVAVKVVVIEGELSAIETPDFSPQFNFKTPSFHGTQAGLMLSSGLQVECGLTAAGIVSANVGPTFSAVFEGQATVHGDVESGCVDMSWDIYGELTAELETEFSLYVEPLIWTKRWDMDSRLTFLAGVEPYGQYAYCWGEAGADSDNDGIPDGSDNCPNTPPGQSVDANGCPVVNGTNAIPTASFTFSPSSNITIADTIQFSDDSHDTDGTIASYSWSFGDGSTGTRRNPSHTYTRPGSYTVTLSVTDNDGDSGLTSKTLTVTTDGGSTVPTSGLIAYYPFNGNATDHSGNGNDGVVQNATLTTDRNGEADAAYAFNGVDSYIDLPDSLLPHDFTVSLWINADSTNDGDAVRRIFDGWTGGELCSLQYRTDITSAPGSSAFIGYDGPGHYLIASLHPHHQGSMIFEERHLLFKVPPLYDTWRFIVLSYENNWAKVYLDGNKVLEFYFDSENHRFYNSGQTEQAKLESIDYSLGTSKRNSGYYKGKIDDVRLYDRALSDAEVHRLYLASESGTSDGDNALPTAGLVAHYPFHDSAGDASGNGNHAVLSGAAGVDGALTIGDNAEDRVLIPHTAVNGLNDFTISVLAKMDTVHATGTYPINTIFSGGFEGQSEDYFDLYYDANNNYWIFQNAGGSLYLHGGSDLEDLDYHHICLTREGSSITLYIDSQQVSTQELNSTPVTVSEGAFLLGQEQDCLSGCFAQNQSWAGKMMNFRIYNRALSLSEIQVLDNEGP